AGIDEIFGSIIEAMGLTAPEERQIAGAEADVIAAHGIMGPAADDEIDLDLGVPMGRAHEERRRVKHPQFGRNVFHTINGRLIIAALCHLTIRQFQIPDESDGTMPKASL